MKRLLLILPLVLIVILFLLWMPLPVKAYDGEYYHELFEHNISRLHDAAGADWSTESTRANEWWEEYNDRHLTGDDRYCEELWTNGVLQWRATYRKGWAQLQGKKLDAVVQIHVRVRDAILDNADRHLSTKENAGTDWMEMKVLQSDVQDYELGYTSGNVRHIAKAVDLLATAIYMCSSSFNIQRLNHIRQDLEETIFDEPVDDVRDIWKIAYRYDGSTGRVKVTTLPYYCKN